MTRARTAVPKLAWLTRRRFLLGAGAAVGAGAAAGAGIDRAFGTSVAGVPEVPLGAQPAGLPARQHAWSAYLARDTDGNPVPPLFDRLLFFDVNGTPTTAHARLLEATLRTLERGYEWLPSGLLFTAGWGPTYFTDVLRVATPIPVATARQLRAAHPQPALVPDAPARHLRKSHDPRSRGDEGGQTPHPER